MAHLSDRTAQYEADLTREKITLVQLDSAVDDLAKLLAAEPWLWNRGDGNGGYVLDRIVRAFGSYGFEVER